MSADTAAELLAEGERLVAELNSLPAGAKCLATYLRLQEVVERAESALQGERS